MTNIMSGCLMALKIASTLAGTITTAGAVTVTAGGANTSAIGQVISELTTR